MFHCFHDFLHVFIIWSAIRFCRKHNELSLHTFTIKLIAILELNLLLQNRLFSKQEDVFVILMCFQVKPLYII